ncbi:MAG: ribosomal protein S6 modification protein [Leptospiraceae bacterium]|nr:MAG: ribosomal protein S6 modification protein [Leptospiraceae bacterium]
MTMQKQFIIIGAKDRIDFPEFGIYDIPCRIDTGALTSSIHCHRVKIKQGVDGKERLYFRLLDPKHPNYQKKDFVVENFTEKKIKSSNGQSEYRFVIQAKVILFGMEIITEFSLADRERMQFPVLLGRKLLNKRFLVDVSKNDLSYKYKQKYSNS